MQIVSPKAVREFTLEGAIFKIGILPFGKRTEIEANAYFNSKAETREQLQSILRQSYDSVKWGVRGHSGLKLEDGTEVPFKMDEAQNCVSEETMEFYAATPGLLAEISKFVQEMNYVKKDAAKN